MSELIGHLRVLGRGGTDVFVFDDCFVRAWTGLGSMVALAADNAINSGAAAIVGGAIGHAGAMSGASFASRLTGKKSRFLTMTPEQIARDDKNNRLVRASEVRSATLSRGRFTQRKQRKLVLQTGTDAVTYKWLGDDAPRPLNLDADVVAMVTAVLGDRLQVTFASTA